MKSSHHKSTRSTPAAKNKILLPRDYLSWSAFDLWNRDPEKFIRHYFYGEPKNDENVYTMFGKMFAQTLEKKRRKHEDPVIDMVVRSIPRLGSPEHRLEAILPSQWGDIPLIGNLDQYDPKTSDFDEFKTGKRKWTPATANNHGQMKFYQLMIWLKKGIMANKKNLIWIETEFTPEGIKPTGLVRAFPVEISLPDLLHFGNQVIKAAKEISDLYQEEINKTL